MWGRSAWLLLVVLAANASCLDFNRAVSEGLFSDLSSYLGKERSLSLSYASPSAAFFLDGDGGGDHSHNLSVTFRPTEFDCAQQQAVISLIPDQ